jgi:FtsP/CotA-like multicopper oxidase with cupredoxin domain
MKKKIIYPALLLLIPVLIYLAIEIMPGVNRQPDIILPNTDYSAVADQKNYENPCKNSKPEWRKAQQIDGVNIAESLLCQPDNPYEIAAYVKGINNVSMATLMNTKLSEDVLTKTDDLDGDGDPDIIRIKLEVIELNGATPDGDYFLPMYQIAPGIRPGLWVYAPKSRGMAIRFVQSKQAHDLLRAPSPVIRVEQGDKVYLTLDNTHYLPHTIHLHGVDHPFRTASGADNDGVPTTGDKAVFPGESHTYEIQPRHAGTMLYHCHVQTDKHLMMGLNGMFVVEENRPNNWVQTFNVGAGQVRHSSVAVKEEYSQEYDLHYQAIDKNLAEIIQNANDPRLIAQRMNREYNMTESNQNYFMLNGHSFPYTLRDALIIAQPDEDIKLRVANTQNSLFALHIHGHKATITDYDGVKQAPGAQITRDIYSMAPAQRLDLHLRTVDDGLHSYGPGIWIFHDHVETGVTTDGMAPGGNIAVLAYRDYIDENGLPKVRASAVGKLFDRYFYAKQKPVWGIGDFAKSLGNAGSLSVNYLQLIGFGLLIGLSLGLILLLFKTEREN